MDTPSLVEVLEKTLRQLESVEDFDHTDPSYAELKRLLVRTIAELEIARLDRLAA